MVNPLNNNLFTMFNFFYYFCISFKPWCCCFSFSNILHSFILKFKGSFNWCTNKFNYNYYSLLLIGFILPAIGLYMSIRKSSLKNIVTKIGCFAVFIFGVLACIIGTIQAILDYSVPLQDKYWCKPYDFNQTSGYLTIDPITLI